MKESSKKQFTPATLLNKIIQIYSSCCSFFFGNNLAKNIKKRDVSHHPPQKNIMGVSSPLKKDMFFGSFGQLFSQTTRRDFTSPVQVPCLSCWMPHVPQLEQRLRWVPPVARWCWAADLHVYSRARKKDKQTI